MLRRKGILRKIDKLPNAKYNTITIGNVTEGTYWSLPKVGQGFILKHFNSTRVRLTSPVTEIVSEDCKEPNGEPKDICVIVFKTHNSLYELKLDWYDDGEE